MPRIPVRVLTSQPQGSRNPAAVSGRSLAPAAVRVSGPAQPKEYFRDRAQGRIQSAVQQSLDPVKSRPDADQVVVPGVSFLATVQQPVQHGLGRAWVGCALVNPQGGYLSYQVAHSGDPRLDAAEVLVTCLNTCAADVVVW